jgi:chromosome segregation ATPase
MAQVLKTMAGS